MSLYAYDDDDDDDAKNILVFLLCSAVNVKGEKTLQSSHHFG